MRIDLNNKLEADRKKLKAENDNLLNSRVHLKNNLNQPVGKTKKGNNDAMETDEEYEVSEPDMEFTIKRDKDKYKDSDKRDKSKIVSDKYEDKTGHNVESEEKTDKFNVGSKEYIDKSKTGSKLQDKSSKYEDSDEKSDRSIINGGFITLELNTGFRTTQLSTFIHEWHIEEISLCGKCHDW